MRRRNGTLFEPLEVKGAVGWKAFRTWLSILGWVVRRTSERSRIGQRPRARALQREDFHGVSVADLRQPETLEPGLRRSGIGGIPGPQQHAAAIKGGHALQPTTTAATVRDSKALTTDGPFAETKEQLASYYLVEAKDRDEAIAIAARIPGARFGSVEVRPVMKFS